MQIGSPYPTSQSVVSAWEREWYWGKKEAGRQSGKSATHGWMNDSVPHISEGDQFNGLEINP